MPSAIVLGSIAAFEGYSEDLLATALYLQGYTFAQVANRSNLSNPDVKDVETILIREFPGLGDRVGVGVQVEAYRPLKIGDGTWWQQESMDWARIRSQGEGWMQVRHCLTHGLATGWRPEVWPGPVRKNDETPASSVLRQKDGGKHSLGLDGAITCARIYSEAAPHFASLLADESQQKLRWTGVPEFPL